MQDKITPSLWYSKDAEEAAKFYASVFPDSRIDRVTTMPAESPSGPAGSVKLVEMTLLGQPFMAMTAGKMDPFNHAISFVVKCEDQAEIDKYWNAIRDNGGTEEPCGWIRDRYGVEWQITPRVMFEFMAAPDRDKAKRATEAMLKMTKFDVKKLQAAFDGR